MYGTHIHGGQSYKLHFTCGSAAMRTSSSVSGSLIDVSGHVHLVSQSFRHGHVLRLGKGGVWWGEGVPANAHSV